MRDKVWFYAAYNHFKIDKVVSGVARERRHRPRHLRQLHRQGHRQARRRTTRSSATIQRGRKQKPQRGLSTLRPPESIQAQDSWSTMYKGEWQWVLTNRAFLNVNVGNFTLDWPMVPAVDPAASRPQLFRVDDGAWRGAGWNAFTTDRKKPQVKAQLTYYLPEKARQPRLQVRVRDLYDSYRFGINGSQRPVPALVSVARERPAPIASASPTPARAATTAADWTVGAEHRPPLRVLRAGSLGAEQPAVDHRRRALRLPEDRLQRRHPQAGDRRRRCRTAAASSRRTTNGRRGATLSTTRTSRRGSASATT